MNDTTLHEPPVAPAPTSSASERARVKARRASGGAAIAAAGALTLIMVLAPLSSAAGFKPITLKPAYKGFEYGPGNSLTTNGCGALADFSHLASFSLSKGVFVGAVDASASVCGAAGSPSYTAAMAEEAAGMVGAPFSVPTTAYHTIRASWTVSYNISLSTFGGTSPSYTFAEGYFYLFGYVYDSTTGSSHYGSAYSWSQSNITYTANFSSYLQVSAHPYGLFSNFTMTAGDVYYWVTYIDITAAAVVLNSGTDFASADLQMFGNGNEGKLTSVTVR